LSEPERVRAEYERRLQGPETGPERAVKHLNKMIANLKKMISRLIDAYGDGLLDKSEFEPRILAARERLAKLEDECRQRIDEANQEVELRLVIGQLEEFARRVSQELQEPGLGHATGGRSGFGEEGRDRRAGGPHRVSGQSVPF
jgi:site-specific DNA recombinase